MKASIAFGAALFVALFAMACGETVVVGRKSLRQLKYRARLSQPR